MLTLRTWRRLALTGAALLILIAIVVAIGVIPAVYSDTSPGAEPLRAANAVWIHAGLNFLTGTVSGLLVIRSRGRTVLARTVLVLGAFVALLLATALIDAASAFRSHGPAMRTTSNLLFVCSATEALAVVLIIAAAIRFPKKQKGA